MAEVATKKTINVVSNKKSEVCSVPSNNGLIDLESITTNNDQLITLCDNNDDEDDLILTNNTHNDLDSGDKSLQELIENELALRICSSSEEPAVLESEDQNDFAQPEPIKRIVLDQKEAPIDINKEFIDAESDHCAVIQEPYTYQNGHVSPAIKISDTSCSENVEPEPTLIGFRDEEEQLLADPPEILSTIQRSETEETEEAPEALEPECEDFNTSQITEPIDKPVDLLNTATESATDDTKAEDVVGHSTSYTDKYEQEEEALNEAEDDVNTEFVHTNGECVDTQTQEEKNTWPEEDRYVDGPQFSDNFDETLVEGDQCAPNFDETVENIPKSTIKIQERFDSFANEEEDNIEEETVSTKIEDQSMERITEDQETSMEPSQGKSSIEEEIEEESPVAMESRGLNGMTVSQSERSEEAASTQEFIDTERRVLSEETSDHNLPEDHVEQLEKLEEQIPVDEDELKEETNYSVADDQNQIAESSSELSVSESTFIEKTEVIVSEHNVTILSVTKCVDELEHDDSAPRDLDSWTTVEEATRNAESNAEELSANPDRPEEQVVLGEAEKEVASEEHESKQKQSLQISGIRAPLATPDETSDVSNSCDSESREETITSSTSVVTSSNVKGGTKTKKKKIEGVAGNDASPNLTPRTKKTKKSKKSDLEKENISVNSNLQDTSMHTGPRQSHPEMIDFANEDDLSNVNVKSLTQNYVSEATRNEQERSCKERIATGVSIKQLKSSFNKFDALSKKTVLHVRSVDAGKVQQQLNAVGQNGDANQNCRSCGKVVFQMEQTKAEGLVWHKNCFRCVQCSKQLNVDNYESHESTLYCKPHFKELFQPKPVEESDQPASDKPDLGLEELSSLNVKSRFQVFEKAGSDTTNEIERSPSQIAVKRSPSILSKLAKFQAKGMDIGVADESLNGIPYEESSESEEEEDIEENEEADTEIVKAKRATRERPMSFTKMDDIKSRWETTSQQGRREVQREARKEEIAGIRSRLFMGKQGKMKEMYQQAVAGSERVTKINAAEELQNSSAHARSIKERFERGETLTASDDDVDSKPKPEKADEEVIAAGISRKSRSLFLELDASAAKTGRPVTPVNPKTPAEAPRRARDMDSPEREIYRDPEVVRAEDRVNDVVHTDTARKMLSIFRQMEENATKKEVPNGPKPLKRFTPPPEDKFAKPTASETDEDEEEEGEDSEGEDSGEERDPNYVRASDKVEDEFLKQAQNAARAKTLCAKFEHWEETDGKVSSNNHIAEMEMAQGEQSSIESARSLKARFESLGSQTNESLRTPKVKVNRFVEIQTTCIDVCESCEKRVYPLEKVETNNKIFHKQCFRCLQCNCILRMDTFTLNNGKLYCIPHFKQLFITRGNYDEGFGVDPHKNKWSSNASQPTSPSPIAVSNGDI